MDGTKNCYDSGDHQVEGPIGTSSLPPPSTLFSHQHFWKHFERKTLKKTTITITIQQFKLLSVAKAMTVVITEEMTITIATAITITKKNINYNCNSNSNSNGNYKDQ